MTYEEALATIINSIRHCDEPLRNTKNRKAFYIRVKVVPDKKYIQPYKSHFRAIISHGEGQYPAVVTVLPGHKRSGASRRNSESSANLKRFWLKSI